MRKLFKRLMIILMAAIMSFSVVACGESKTDTPDNPDTPVTPVTPVNPGDSDEETLPVTTDTPKNAVTETAEHFVTNGLHKVTVTDTGRKFYTEKDGLRTTEYKIVYDYNANNAKAAAFMREHIASALRVSIEFEKVTEGMTYTADSKVIVINTPSFFTAAGLTMPEDNLGVNGYYIKNVGNSYFIAVQNSTGVQSGAIAFLRQLIGYEMYSDDTVVYDRTADTIPDMEIIEKPDFDIHIQGNSVSSEAIYGMGFQSSSDIFIAIEGETWHNSLNLLPKDTYKSKHSKWYSTKNNELCYTAHGDDTEYKALIDEASKRMLYYINKNPNKPVICLTIEDHQSECECAECKASKEKYNGSNAAALIKFMNAINRKIQAQLLEDAGGVEANKRQITILFFAYNKMERPPVKQNEVTGEWEPIDDTVICDPEVGVYIAPINAYYNQSFYHENNASAKQVIEGWGALSTKLYMWLYETNYRQYMYPLNTYDTMIETYRFCKANNAVYMMNEGQYNQGNVTHFSKLKEYFNARAEFNVNDNYADIVDDFFANYFAEAVEPMRKYFDELQAHLRYLEVTSPSKVNGNIYNNMNDTSLWSFGMLNNYMKLIEEAYEKIEPLKTTNYDRYLVLQKHIKLESMFPRYALLSMYGGMYSEADRYTLRSEFKKDCGDLNITYYQETTSMDEIFSSWGL